jgi:hypothetical protein
VFLTNGMMGKAPANLKCHLIRHLQRELYGQFRLFALTARMLHIYSLGLMQQTIGLILQVFCAQF